jgi:hypothetical protein
MGYNAPIKQGDQTVKNFKVVRKIQFADYMKQYPFEVGFQSVRANRKPDYDLFTDTNSQWAYERGRQFALAYPGKSYRRGRGGAGIAREALALVRDLVADKAIL